MKYDEKALEAAFQTVIGRLGLGDCPDETDIAAAISAYCEKAGVVMVPMKTAGSATSLLMGLSAYWEELGDAGQSSYVEKVARALFSASQEEE